MAWRSRSRVVGRRRSGDLPPSRPSSAASRSPRSRAAKASAPMPWRESWTRAAMPAAAKSLGVRLDRLQRLLLRPALEPRPAQARRRRRRGAAPVRPPRAARARRRRPAARRPCEGSSESKKASTLAGGTAPTNSSTTSPSRKAFTAGIPCTPKRARERLVGVDVDLGQQRPGRRGSPRPLPAPGSAPGRARTTRPRSRPRPGSSRRARRRRDRRSLRLRRWPSAQLRQARRLGAACPCAAGRRRYVGCRQGQTEEERCRTSTPPGPPTRPSGAATWPPCRSRSPRTPSGSPRTSCRSAERSRAATRSWRTSPRSPTTGRRSASSPRSSSTPASTWSSAAPSGRATTRAASRRPSCTCCKYDGDGKTVRGEFFTDSAKAAKLLA